MFNKDPYGSRWMFMAMYLFLGLIALWPASVVWNWVGFFNSPPTSWWLVAVIYVLPIYGFGMLVAEVLGVLGRKTVVFRFKSSAD